MRNRTDFHEHQEGKSLQPSLDHLGPFQQSGVHQEGSNTLQSSLDYLGPIQQSDKACVDMGNRRDDQNKIDDHEHEESKSLQSSLDHLNPFQQTGRTHVDMGNRADDHEHEGSKSLQSSLDQLGLFQQSGVNQEGSNSLQPSPYEFDPFQLSEESKEEARDGRSPRQAAEQIGGKAINLCWKNWNRLCFLLPHGNMLLSSRLLLPASLIISPQRAKRGGV